MKALLKSNVWVDLDTSCLFNNQYNTMDGKRIFDQDIKAIKDDARINMGKCKYCGKLVRKGEEEQHFTEQENKGCNKCFWYRERVTDRQVTEQQDVTTNEKGERITTRTRVTKEKIDHVCTYSETGNCRADCTHKECRQYGIEWFTPDNTFFLKYPNGFDSIPEIDKLPARGFVIENCRQNAYYAKKLGSYHLEALLTYNDKGKPIGVKAYRISNCRRNYIFRYENGELFTDKYSFGWYKVKTLDGIPANVMQAVKMICNH